MSADADERKSFPLLYYLQEVRYMNKPLLFALAAAGIAVAGAITAQTVLANGPMNADISAGYGYDRMIQAKADILGMSPEDLKSQPGEKTFVRIAEENGISLDAFQQDMKERAMERWQEAGLSDEEIRARIRRIEERHQNADGACDGSGMMHGRGGQGFGRGK